MTLTIPSENTVLSCWVNRLKGGYYSFPIWDVIMIFVKSVQEKQRNRSGKPMSKNEIEDELRPEYDLQSLQVRKLGPGRKRFCDTVCLEPDLIAAFPNA